MTTEEDEKKEAEQKAEEEAKNKAEAAEAEKVRAEEGKRIDDGVAELKKQNEEKANLLEREEKLQDRKEALQALGGGSGAGQAQEKQKEETAKEYKDRVVSGDL